MACTTILVGKKASYDGSTMIARNDDSGSGHFTAKKFVVVQPEEHPAVYKSVISHVEVPLPGDALRMTAMPNAGPMSFALLMGTARLIYGKFGDRLNLDRFMKYSCVLCMASYLCIVFVPVPFVGLLGCAVCGFSVGILWPGTFSKASAAIKGGGTAMFAMLALAGDVGCSGGPTLAGLVSSAFQNDLHIGILAAIVFPVLLLVSLFLSDRETKKA